MDLIKNFVLIEEKRNMEARAALPGVRLAQPPRAGAPYERAAVRHRGVPQEGCQSKKASRARDSKRRRRGAVARSSETRGGLDGGEGGGGGGGGGAGRG